MRVRFSDEALTRLRAIHGYIAEDAPNRADAMIDRLTRRAERIGDVPYAGCVVPEYRLDTLREVLERPYRINLPNQSGRDRNRYSDALPPTAPRKHCVSMCADRRLADERIRACRDDARRIEASRSPLATYTYDSPCSLQ